MSWWFVSFSFSYWLSLMLFVLFLCFIEYIICYYLFGGFIVELLLENEDLVDFMLCVMGYIGLA